jgi:DNA (cytosine-5)-methyltransferase 1
MELCKNKNVDTTQTTTHIGLCAGYGGIEIGLQRVIPNLRSVALCEIEAFACANLVAKMEAGLMDAAPIWTDLKTFPWAEFRDRVDILTGGYPCQPFSAAGKRAGKDDPRHLWPWIADGIRALRPRACFLENVEGHISLGLPTVISDLEELGYKVSWGIFSAAEVGAPHQRKRVFILAYRIESGLERLSRYVTSGYQPGWDNAQASGSIGAGCLWRRVSFAADCEGYDEETSELGNICSVCGLDYCDECQCPRPTQDGMEYAERDGILYARPESHQAWPSRPGEPQHGWEPPRVVGAVPKKLADFCSRDSQQRGDTAPPSGEGSSQRGEGADAMPHSGSSVCGGDQGNKYEVVGNAESGWRGESRDEISARQGHWTARPSRSDEQHSQAQPSLGRDADGPAGGLGYAELQVSCDNRTDELRLLGNGVVPATAEKAFRILSEELYKK